MKDQEQIRERKEGLINMIVMWRGTQTDKERQTDIYKE